MKNNAYNQMKERLLRSAYKNKTPIIGHFELTARCNLDCKMCYVHTKDNTNALCRELSTEQWKRIFDEAYDCEMLYATLSGGECLIRKDFCELYLHLWNKQVMISVQTNATLINEDYVRFFTRYKPESIQISLYGSNEEGYLHVTGHQGFEKAMWAINALKDAGIDLRIVTTPSKYMTDDYIELVCLCKKLNLPLNEPDFILVPNREDPTRNDYFLSEDEILLLLKRRAELDGTLVPRYETPEPVRAATEASINKLKCTAGGCMAAVTWDGMMYPCLNLMVDGISLLEVSYSEAWKKVKAAAERIILPVECFSCPYDSVCPKCPAHRLSDLHSGHCDPAVCEMTRKLVAAGVKKLDIAEQGCE